MNSYFAMMVGILSGFLIYYGLSYVAFKTNTVRLVVSVIIGVSLFTVLALQMEGFTSVGMMSGSGSGSGSGSRSGSRSGSGTANIARLFISKRLCDKYDGEIDTDGLCSV